MAVALARIEEVPVAALQRETILELRKTTDDVDDGGINGGVDQVFKRESPLLVILLVLNEGSWCGKSLHQIITSRLQASQPAGWFSTRFWMPFRIWRW